MYHRLLLQIQFTLLNPSLLEPLLRRSIDLMLFNFFFLYSYLLFQRLDLAFQLTISPFQFTYFLLILHIHLFQLSILTFQLPYTLILCILPFQILNFTLQLLIHLLQFRYLLLQIQHGSINLLMVLFLLLFVDIM